MERGVYGLVFWLPGIVKHLTGHGIGSTGLLTAVPYAAAVVAMIAASAGSDHRAHRRAVTWIPPLIAAICFAASYLTRGGTFTTSFIVAAAGMYAPSGPYFASIPELLPARDAAPAVGLINAFGALDGFAGRYTVGALGGGTSAVPFVFLAACLLSASGPHERALLAAEFLLPAHAQSG